MQELSMHILDIVENSTRADARLVEICITEDRMNDLLTIEINDDGAGMDRETLAKVLDPFYSTKRVRRIGLGIPLLAYAARTAGGDFHIDSKRGLGTRVRVRFRHSHIDRQPIGNMAETMVTLIAGNPATDFIYNHANDHRKFSVDTREIRKELEDVPVNHPEVLKFIKEAIKDGLKEIGVSD